MNLSGERRQRWEYGRMAAARSRIERLNGLPVLEVDGYPFFVLGAQCDIWRSTTQGSAAETFFAEYAAMNATAVGIGVPWSRIETARDQYDFAFLDWFVQQAEKVGLKLVINLFNTNVCGKVMESHGDTTLFPTYAPAYILDAPNDYQRMELREQQPYDAGGPPLCPNDPRTLQRERRYVVKVAEHLRRTDHRNTVIMLQIDNEFYYQQWSAERPRDERQVRCHCAWCEARYDPAYYATPEEFMFRSFAVYVSELAAAIKQVHDIPIYLNSPWWDPYIVDIFLRDAPGVDLVGIDGVNDPLEPNWLSRSQVGRNIPFAAENPTENPHTRTNLDVLPYYTILGQQGIGNLLWECYAPFSVIGDATAVHRYGTALYPLKHALAPIARARGTGRFVGWYALRASGADRTAGAQGDSALSTVNASAALETGLFLRHGHHSWIQESTCFVVSMGELACEIRDSPAGVILREASGVYTLAIPCGTVRLRGPSTLAAEEGRFAGDVWQPIRPFPIKSDADGITLRISEPAVIRVTVKTLP